MIALRGRLAGAALTCAIAIASSACNAVFGLGPVEGSTGDAAATDAGPCVSASGSLTISTSSLTSPLLTMNLADSHVSVASGYDGVLDQSSFTIKTAQVDDPLCSAAVTVVISGRPIAGKAYKVIPSVTDPRFAMERDAWVKLDIDDDTAAMCHDPARWEPEQGLVQSLTVEAFDESSVELSLSKVRLEGVVNASSPVTVNGTAQSSCFGAK